MSSSNNYGFMLLSTHTDKNSAHFMEEEVDRLSGDERRIAFIENFIGVMEEDGETGRGEEEVDVSGLDRVRNDCEELLDYSQFKIVWVRSWRCVDHCGARDITASVELDHTQWYCSVRQASLWHIMKYSYIVWGDVGYSWERALMYDWISGYSMRLCLHVVVRTHGLGGDCWGNYVVILLMWAWVLEFIRTTRVEHEIIRWGHDTAVDGLARYGSILSFSLIGLVGEWWDGDSQGQGFDCCSTERGEVDGGGDTVWDTHGVLMDEYRGDEDETTSCDVGHMNLEVPVVVIEGGYVEGGCLRYEYHLVGEVRCRLLWSKVGGFERYGVMSITQMCSIDYAVDKSSVNETKFESWMEQNETNTFSRSLLYVEIPRGPMEWDVLKKVDNVLYPTYKDTWSLKDIQNMTYADQEYTMDGYNKLIFDETSYYKDKLKEQHVKLYGNLTYEQKDIYSTVMNAVVNDKGGMFFVYGYGGTGKTYLYKTMLTQAALQHSKLIIWDEAPMINRNCYEAFDRTLRDICMTDPSVASDKDVVNATINASYLWDKCTVLRLTINMRLGSGSTQSEKKEIQEFADWILDIGNGKVGGANDAVLLFLTDVKKKLDQPGNEKRKTLFLATKFGIWFDLWAFANDNHLLNYIFHHQEFCLITGFLFGKLPKEESYKGIPNCKFLDRIFPDSSSKRVKKVKGDDLMELFTNDELWFGISDHDVVRRNNERDSKKDKDKSVEPLNKKIKVGKVSKKKNKSVEASPEKMTRYNLYGFVWAVKVKVFSDIYNGDFPQQYILVEEGPGCDTPWPDDYDEADNSYIMDEEDVLGEFDAIKATLASNEKSGTAFDCTQLEVDNPIDWVLAGYDDMLATGDMMVNEENISETKLDETIVDSATIQATPPLNDIEEQEYHPTDKVEVQELHPPPKPASLIYNFMFILVYNL
ncbi:ATP-dependent DNA helicase RRM3-like protein, partial [Tanacetum coccineum]